MGEVKAVLYVSSSALDTDVAVKLVDVYPDGRAFNLYDAMQRLRYRDGYDRPTPFKPGEVYGIEIAGSNFPNFERNLQTGGSNYDEVKGVVAINRIHHSAGRTSYLELPVVPR